MFSFDEIIGNEQIVKNLKSAVLNKRISHSYIFDAPKGMGKKTIANAFAKAILCEEGNGKACGKCRSCISFDSKNNPDVIYIKSNKKSIGVDDVREQIGKNIELKPFLYKYKIFIIDDADTMTVQAQNALLKTLEEPPSYGLFLLLSNNISNFLITILSRCVTFKLKPLSPTQIQNYLINNGININNAEIFAEYSQGSLGKAIEISQNDEFSELRNNVISILVSLKNRDLIQMFKAITELDKYKDKIQDVLDIFLLMYRDAIIYKNFFSNKYIIQKDKLNEIKNICQSDTIERLTERYDAVFDAKKQLKANGNFQMIMEVLFIKLKEK